ncbi:MAG TPA: AAA family ATPase [Acidimicrobiales bacterium]|nr:AAA family ATPase [Acidimicrobiales bacterium]
MIGREAELASIDTALQRAMAGESGRVLIEGEGGIGKSALLAEAVNRGSDFGFLIVRGEGEEVPVVPFGLWVTAKWPDAGALELSLSESGDATYPLIEAVLARLEDLASRSPVLVALEDLHWADAPSLKAVTAAIRRLTGLPVVIMATARPVLRSVDLDRVDTALGDTGGLRIRLGPLDGVDAARLAGVVAGATAGPGLERQVDGASGNPLYIVELVRALAEDGGLRVTAEQAETTRDTAPPSLRHTLLRRLSSLPTGALELLRFAALLGSRFSLADVAAISGRTSVELAGTVEEIVRAGFLVDGDDQLAFRHDLVRNAVYTDIPAAVRKGLHRDAARFLAAAGAAPLRVAEQLRLGALPGDREAVMWLTRAVDELRGRFPDVAVGLLEDALAIIEPTSPERDRLTARLVSYLTGVGRGQDAQRLATEALDHTPPPEIAADLRDSLAQIRALGGDIVGAAVEVEELARDQRLPEARRAELYAVAAQMRLNTGDIPRILANADQAELLATRSGNDYALATVLGSRAMLTGGKGQITEALELADRAAAAALRHRHPEAAPNETASSAWRLEVSHPVDLSQAALLIEADRFDEAEAIMRAEVLRAEHGGGGGWLAMVHAWRARHGLHAGQWDAAVADAELGLVLAGDTGNRLGMLICYGVLARIALHRGNLEEAANALHLAQAEMASSGPGVGADLVVWALALWREATDDFRRGFDVLAMAWDMTPALRYIFSYQVIGPDFVRLALKLGERERARAVTEAVELGAARSGVNSAAGAAMRCRGALDGDPDLLLRAAALYRPSARRPEHLMAATDAGLSLADCGRTEEAIVALCEAFDLADALGAGRDRALVEAALRGLGFRQRRAATVKRPAFGWDSLTDTERRIVELVTEGLTNRQIGERLYVSRRTVETHVSHVFSKLGMTSRAQLAAAAAVSRR